MHVIMHVIYAYMLYMHVIYMHVIYACYNALIYACSLWFICSQSKREFLKNGIRAKDCRICRKSQ